MASLVLSGAGMVIGSFFGPLGAAVGQLAGSMLASALFPDKVQGPRLTELKLQGSQYGSMIPLLYGTDRLSGQIIWQTDLIEHEETSDGKGGPEVTTFTYTASFAVLLCAGPIIGVSRIWADGRLVHDTVDYTSTAALIFTLYLGDEAQLPDPTMEAVLGAGNVPAHRGYAYIVFTDLAMGEYGNRIPNFTFEVTTVSPVSRTLHIVAQNNALPHAWRHVAFATIQGIGLPAIYQWGQEGKIVIKNLSGQSHDYNLDLTYSGPSSFAGNQSPDLLVEGPPGGGGQAWLYYSCGTVLMGGVEVPVFCYPTFQIKLGTQNAALAGYNVWSDDGDFTECSAELGFSAGIPTGRYISGVSITQDKTAMFVFTSATPTAPGAGSADTWYMIVDGVVAGSGAMIDGHGGVSYFGFSNAASAFTGLAVNMFENNRKFMWKGYGAGAGNRFTLFSIDNNGDFDENAVASYAEVNEPAAFVGCSIYVFKEGFCGGVWASSLAIASRFPLFSPTGPTLAEVVKDLSLRAGLTVPEIDVTDLEADYVEGYKIAQQGPVRGMVGQLQSGYLFDGVESDGVVKFIKRGKDAVITVPDEDLGCCMYGDEPPPPLAISRVQEVELPRVVWVNFTNKDAAYQPGAQYAERQVTDSQMDTTVSLAIVMTPSRARQNADLLLYHEWLERERMILQLPRKYAYLEPTDVIVAKNRTLRLTNKDESMAGVIKFDAVPSSTRVWLSGPAGAPSSGFTPGLVAVKQRTDLVMMDIPLIDDSDEQPGYYLSMAGRTSPRWRGATLYKSTDNGANYTKLDTYTTAGTFGATSTVLGDYGGGNTFDEGNTVDVSVTKGGSDLVSATIGEVLNGANRALIGKEIIQFKSASLTGTRQYTLSGLLRGRYGTEWAMGAHVAIEPFVMLPAHDRPMGYSELNLPRLYKAVSPGDTLAQTDPVLFANTGVRMKPLSPVQVGGGSDASGNITINWTRRSRYGSAIGNGVTPLGENNETYVLEIWDETFTDCARVITGITAPTYQYTGAMQVTDFGANQETVSGRVAMLGAIGLGYQTEFTIPGTGPDNDTVLVPVPPYVAPPPPPPPGGTVDDNDWAQFQDLYYNEAPYLAYHYGTTIGLVVGTGWFPRYLISHITPIIFGGSSWAAALWQQDSTYNHASLTAPESADLQARAVAARS